MRIVIDLQGAQSASRHRGIGRYSLAFTEAIARLARQREHEVLIALNGIEAAANRSIRRLLGDHVAPEHFLTWYPLPGVHHVDDRNDARRQLSECLREAFLAALDPDIVIVTSLIDGAADSAVSSVGRWRDLPTAAILYDLIPLLCAPDYLSDPRLQRWYRDKTSQLARADFLLGISGQSVADAVRFLDYPADRCVNIGGGIAGDFHAGPAREDLSSLGITKPFFLYVSGMDERKNQRGLIEAYALLSKSQRERHQLVLAGHMEDIHVTQLREAAAQAGLKPGQFVCLGHVNEATLRGLYRSCHCFVFPSKLEGFGLPVLEAMAFDRPVICSAIPVLEEVHGLKAAMFDPRCSADIAAKMALAASDEDFRSQLISHARQQLKQFTWDATAQKALQFLEQMVAICPRAEVSHDRMAEASRQFVREVRSAPELAVVDPLELATAITRTFPPDSRRQLLVDVSELVARDARTGVQRVVRSLLKCWVDEPLPGWKIEPVYATMEGTGYRYARQFMDAFLGGEGPWREDDAVEVWSGDVFLALDLQLHILPRQADVLQSWRDRGVLTLAVVYDLLPLKFPELFPEGWGAAQQEWMEAIAQFDGTVSISQATRAEVQNWRDNHPQHENPHAMDQWFGMGADLAHADPTRGLPQQGEALLARMRGTTSFLMVGTIEPRKGHDQVLDAFERIWPRHPDWTLTIIGRQGWGTERLVERIRQLQMRQPSLTWIANGSDEFLECAYASTTCLIGASKGEGFGLPLIEAAVHGVPLLVRDLPVFREVAGEHASYFPDSDSPEVLAGAIEAWCDRHVAGTAPASHGIAAKSWRESALQLRNLVTQWDIA